MTIILGKTKGTTMKRFIKVMLAAWLTGIVLGAGCFCGAVGTGMLVPRSGTSDDYKFVQAQIEEIQETLESFTVYDSIAARGGFDEMAGLEDFQ